MRRRPSSSSVPTGHERSEASDLYSLRTSDQEAFQHLRTDTEQNKSQNESLTLSLNKAIEANAGLQQEKEAPEKQLSALAETNKAEGELTAKLQEAEKKRAEAEGKLAETEKKVVEISKKQRETQQKSVVIAAQSKKLNQKKPKSESLNRKKLNKKISRKRDSGQA